MPALFSVPSKSDRAAAAAEADASVVGSAAVPFEHDCRHRR